MMDTISAFSPKIRATFSIFKKGQGRPPPPPSFPLPLNCAPVYQFVLVYNPFNPSGNKRLNILKQICCF